MQRGSADEKPKAIECRRIGDGKSNSTVSSMQPTLLAERLEDSSGDEGPSMSKEESIRTFIRAELAAGRFVTPKTLDQRFFGIHGQNGINGMASRVRREELERAGYVKGSNGRWTKA